MLLGMFAEGTRYSCRRCVCLLCRLAFVSFSPFSRCCFKKLVLSRILISVLNQIVAERCLTILVNFIFFRGELFNIIDRNYFIALIYANLCDYPYWHPWRVRYGKRGNNVQVEHQKFCALRASPLITEPNSSTKFKSNLKEKKSLQLPLSNLSCNTKFKGGGIKINLLDRRTMLNSATT